MRDKLDQALAAALAEWQAAGGDTSGISATVGDLGGLTLGATSGRAITIDSDAAGWGWGAMDLGTVVRHEVGHALGLGHGGGLMDPSLSPGETARRCVRTGSARRRDRASHRGDGRGSRERRVLDIDV